MVIMGDAAVGVGGVETVAVVCYISLLIHERHDLLDSGEAVSVENGSADVLFSPVARCW